LAARQPQLFDGVHLPDRVGLRGPVPVAGGFAARGSRGLLLTTEPALQRPDAGEIGEFGMELAQPQAEIGCSPGWMLLVQEQGLLEGRAGLRRRQTRIGRPQRRLPLAVKRSAQAAHRARRELQPLGNDGGRMSLLPEDEDPLTLHERQRCRHR
jgi:hypothetical protein